MTSEKWPIFNFLAHIVGRERDRIIARDVGLCKVIF